MKKTNYKRVDQQIRNNAPKKHNDKHAPDNHTTCSPNVCVLEFGCSAHEFNHFLRFQFEWIFFLSSMDFVVAANSRTEVE